MNWIKYNEDDTKKGFECRYAIEAHVLHIEAWGNDSPHDWRKSFSGSLDIINVRGVKYPRPWYRWGFRFGWHVRNLDFAEVSSRSHSMGTAVIAIALEMLVKKATVRRRRNISFGGARVSFNKRHTLMTFYKNAWDWITWLPPWFKSNKPGILSRKPMFIYEAHMNYNWRFPK